MRYTCKDLLQRIRTASVSTPDKIACWTGCEGITYHQLEEMSDRIAAHIGSFLLSIECRNFNETVRIGVNMQRTNKLLPAIYAIMKLGCTYVPIDTDVPEKRKKFIMGDGEIHILLTDSLVEEYLNTVPDTTNVPFYDQPEAYVIYTSGTTGKPKGVVIRYDSLYHFIKYIGDKERLDINKDSVLLFFTSINFDVSIIEIFGTLFYGATMVTATEDDKHNMQSLVSLINNRQVTYASLPTSLLAIMETLDFSHLNVLVSIGEPIQKSVAERTMDKPYRYVNGYGPAECTVLATLSDIKSPDTCNNIGHTLPGVTAYVVDQDMRKVKPGEEGELLLGGIQLMPGYINRPELNAKAIVKNPFADGQDEAPLLYHTGDIVRLEADGTYFFIGRRDSQIKLHGHRIELGEITSHISSCNGVTAAYARLETIADSKHIVAYVVFDENVTSLEAIRHYLITLVPEYMIPSFWNALKEFPLNINGKIDATKLVNKAIEGVTDNDGPLTEQEETLMNVIGNVIGLPSINIDADLIEEVGVSSLQLLRIHHDIQIACIDVSVADFYKHRTIRKIAASHKKAINFWYNDDDNTTKPVIVALGGYTYFSYLFYKFAEILSDTFSIYVLESYHAIIGNRTEITADEMNDIYIDLVKDVCKKHHVAAFMGFCLGGEHGLMLAHSLYKDSAYKPAAIILDGEVDRDCDPTKNANLWFPFYSRETNIRRSNIDLMLMRTTPKFHYEGKVGVFLCSVFIDYWSVLDPEMTEKKDYWMRKFFDTNPERWKKAYPEADITMLPTHHCDFWLTEPSLSIICDYVKGLA